MVTIIVTTKVAIQTLVILLTSQVIPKQLMEIFKVPTVNKRDLLVDMKIIRKRCTDMRINMHQFCMEETITILMNGLTTIITIIIQTIAILIHINISINNNYLLEEENLNLCLISMMTMMNCTLINISKELEKCSEKLKSNH